MKIFVTGTRGIPYIPGGIESHCQELYPLIAQKGHNVTVATRSPYVKKKIPYWQEVKLCHLYAPHSKSFEAIVHTFLAILKAKSLGVDILHIHAVGPGLMVPFAKSIGHKVVFTHHGPDYKRQKWGKIAKTILVLGEYLASKYADEVITISKEIQNLLKVKYDRKSNLIFNGVTIPLKSKRTDFLEKLSIKPQNYIFSAARFVPEKGLHDLIEAFKSIKGDWQLVIAGDADHETAYSKRLKELAQQDKRIILTGYVTGEELNQLFTNARLFVLPSYYEGLPIALLEAMSYDLPVLVSDISANKEVPLEDKNCFFRCGDIRNLEEKIKFQLQNPVSDELLAHYKKLLNSVFNWKIISDQTIDVYVKAINK